MASSPQFREVQKEGPELQALRTQALYARDGQRGTFVGNSYFEVRNHLLYWVQRGNAAEQEGTQLVVPTQFCQIIWRLTHVNPMGGHLGHDKTIARVTRCFFWLGLGVEVAHWCVAYPECQKVREDHPARAPLQPLPVIDAPFSRIAMDVIGPLPCSSAGHQYILVFINYAT